MKVREYITEREFEILKISYALTLLFTFASVSLKFISGYNRAIKESLFEAEWLANASSSVSFSISDCYKFYNHPALFTLFSIFVFLFSLNVKKFTRTSYFSILSFSFLFLSILQATYLHSWFAAIAKIQWNSTLVLPDVFDAILYFCFAGILVIQLKVIYRFTKEKFPAKIS